MIDLVKLIEFRFGVKNAGEVVNKLQRAGYDDDFIYSTFELDSDDEDFEYLIGGENNE